MYYPLQSNAYQYSNNYCNGENYAMSNFRYEGDRFKVNANVNSTGALCFVGGAAVGAVLTYYLLNKLKENK
jgi:hypothetical protein